MFAAVTLLTRCSQVRPGKLNRMSKYVAVSVLWNSTCTLVVNCNVSSLCYLCDLCAGVLLQKARQRPVYKRHSSTDEYIMGSVSMEQPLWLSSLQYQRLLTNRSPFQSPPIAKKFFRSSCCQLQQQSKSSLWVVDDGDTACKDNRSILKRSRSKSWHAGQSSRRVNFHENVAVVVYDRADGEYVCSQSQQLNTEPRDRRRFVCRTLLAHSVRSNNSTSTSSSSSSSSSLDKDSALRQCCALVTNNGQQPVDTGKDSLAGLPTSRPLPTTLTPLDNSSQPVTGLDFTFHEDRGGQLWLRFTVPLGLGVKAGDALVKANMAGNKVRVLGRRSVKGDDATLQRQEFATRFALPMDVDPYAITARMDSTGNLFIEAPVMTGERRCRNTATAECTVGN